MKVTHIIVEETVNNQESTGRPDVGIYTCKPEHLILVLKTSMETH
jgi:hypothetical protein